MIRTVYRRPDAPTTPGDAFVGVDPLDPLTGAVPSWRLDEEPIYLECVRDLGVPGRDEVPVDVEVVEVEVPGSSRLDEDDAVVVDLPTRALTLRAVEDEPLPDLCPDCGATGLDPCRPKGDPRDGRPLTRWHRRRRLLVERDAGRGGVLLLLLVVVLVLAVAGGVGGLLSSALDDLTRPCVAATASGLGPGCEP